LATQAVAAPCVAFQGLRSSGSLKSGTAYAAPLAFSVDNGGQRVAPPTGKTFVVYANDSGAVFDWDWVEEEPGARGHPIGYATRFVTPIESPREAVITGLGRLAPGTFSPENACHSPAGDCIFCYLANDESFARQVNDDVTVFHSIKTNEIVGFKLKNISALVRSAHWRERVFKASNLEVRILLMGSWTKSYAREIADDERSAYERILGPYLNGTANPTIEVSPAWMIAADQASLDEGSRGAA
jgi:hypothetical protein